jgi:Ca2+-binding EF-hand superfamily protein
MTLYFCFVLQLIRMINKDVSPEDVDLIYLIFDDENNGLITKSEFRSIMQKFSSNIRR